MLGLPDQVQACLFDMDGVLTRTATVHAAAWKEMFDAYLREHAHHEGVPFVAFDADSDYRAYVDGKPREDGTRSFLASRGIALPEGAPTDDPTLATVHGLANRKRDLVMAVIARDGVTTYPDAMEYLAHARKTGLATAVVSSSAHAYEILQAAGIASDFDAVIDGKYAADHALPGKPAPDIFLAGAAALQTTAEHAAVFEDAIAGVQAGRAGKFGLVIGVDRVGEAEALRQAGADLIVSNLTELLGGEA